MSPRFSVIPARAIHELDGLDLKVLLMLGTHTDNEGWCEVSQTKMAELLSKARETINRVIKRLCDAGYVQKLEPSGRRSICYYRVILDRGEPDETQDLVVTQGSQQTPETDFDVTPASQQCDVQEITGGVISKHVTHKRPYSNEKKKNTAPREAAEPASPNPDPQPLDRRSPAKAGQSLEPYRLACELIGPELAGDGLQGEWLGRLFDFIVKRGGMPDRHELEDLKRKAEAAKRELTALGNGKLLESSRRREASLYRDIIDTQRKLRGEAA